MFNNLLYEIAQLKTFILVYLAIIVAIVLVLFFLTRSFKYNSTNIKIFSLLLGMNNRQKVAVALALSRYIFVILSLIFYKDVSVGTFAALMGMTLAIMILTADWLSIVTGLLNYTAIYAINYLESTLFAFYTDVERYWAVLAMGIILAVFVALYATYHLFYTYNRIINKPGKDFKWRLPKLKLKAKQK